MQLYWKIVERGEWIEYHCSVDRRDVQNLRALSAKIRKDSGGTEGAKRHWLRGIHNLGKHMVEVTDPESELSVLDRMLWNKIKRLNEPSDDFNRGKLHGLEIARGMVKKINENL